MPLLTLTSDFGASDPLVGMVKGEILHQNEGFHLVDLTHDISPLQFHASGVSLQIHFQRIS